MKQNHVNISFNLLMCVRVVMCTCMYFVMYIYEHDLPKLWFSAFASTAFEDRNFVSHICRSSWRTCSSTPSSKNNSRTPEITSFIISKYTLS